MSPINPLCRNNFDPGVFSCAGGETRRNDPLHPKSPQQLAISVVLGREHLTQNRDKTKLRSSGFSDSKIAICLSKTQRHPLRVKTIVGLSLSQSTVWVRGNTVDLGHRTFRTNKEAQEYFRGEIAKRDVGTVITSEEDFFRDVRSLVERHPERDQKVGVGIDAFVVRLDENRNKMLWLRRTDGSSTDFSYLTCIRGSGMSSYGEFTDAARSAVRPDVSQGIQGRLFSPMFKLWRLSVGA